VDFKKQSDPGVGELRVLYTIDAGARHKLVKLSITGNKYFAEELLRSNLHIQAAGVSSRTAATARHYSTTISVAWNISI